MHAPRPTCRPRHALFATALLLSACGGGGSPPAGAAPSAPVIASFGASPASVTAGGTSTLSWSVSGATSLSVSPSPGPVTGSTAVVAPAVTTTYVLTASNAAGSVTASATVNVITTAPVISRFAAFPSAVAPGGSATLGWTVVGASSLTIDAGVGAVTGTSRAVAPAATTTYTLTATNALGTTSATATVTVGPPALQPACTGAGCGVASATQYSGSGVGVWQFHNTTAATLSIDVDVSGVAAGNQAALVFSNGSSTRSGVLPSPGTLAAPPPTLLAANGVPAAEAAAPEAGDVDPGEAERLAAHADLLRRNREAASRLRLDASAPAASVLAAAAAPVQAAAAVGDTRTWNESYGNTGTYTTLARATCTLPTGRTAVFWVDPNATSRGTVTDANLAYFQSVLCGASGGYARVVGALGDVWGPAAAKYSNVIRDGSPGPLDLNVAILQVPAQSKWSGYFSASNNLLRSSDATSNEALVFFIDASQVAVSYAYIGSTLLHEMTHMVNFYQRDVARGLSFAHDTWLEETTAMMTEDIVTPAVSPGRYSTIPGQRVRFYVKSGGAVSLLDWSYPAGDSYAVGGSLAGFLDRRYGTAIWAGAVGCPAVPSWDCLDGLVRSAGGAGLVDDFARLGATVFGLVPAAGAPAGYGFPLGTWGGFTLDAIDTTTYASQRPASATPLGLDFAPGTHTYQLDTIPAGVTRYRRTGVSVPAGTSLMLVVK